jgi:hypothetical protein
MTDEPCTNILQTNDCLLCDKFDRVSSSRDYCNYYMGYISLDIIPIWKYKNLDRIHCIHYQMEKENAIFRSR